MKREEFEIEVCVTSIQSVIAAEKGGANRVELCDNLYEGGTTPSAGTILQAKEKTNIDVSVMIRPRGGDFLYSEEELQIMMKDIQKARELGADGIVFGCLKPDGNVDEEVCKRLMEQAKDTPVTFHRAFDMTPDPFEAIDVIKSLGIQRILTSGQKNIAPDGKMLLADLIEKSNGKPEIMIGSGVDETNILELAKYTKANIFHVTLQDVVESKMEFRKQDIFMGGLPQIPEYSKNESSTIRIEKLISNLLLV